MITMEQQIAIVKKIGEGLTSKEISKALACNIKTLESHIAEMKKEYGAKNSANLVQIFHQRNFIK